MFPLKQIAYCQNGSLVPPCTSRVIYPWTLVAILTIGNLLQRELLTNFASLRSAFSLFYGDLIAIGYIMTSIRAQAVFIFICGLFLFTIGLSSQEIIGFESRFYLFAQEMWRHGGSWFPMTYQQPYPDYPGTATFLIYAFSKLCGGLNKFTAIFPSAVAASITLSMTYLIGSTHSRYWGMGSVLFLLFTMTFVTEARTISIDQYVTAITAVSFYICCRSKAYLSSWIFVLMVLGFTFRGPLGLVIPAGVVCVFYLVDKDFKRFILVGILSAILLALCSTLLLSIANHVGGANFMHEVMQKQVFGRMQADAQTPPFYFYFVEPFGAYLIAYPLAMFVLLGLIPNFDYSQSTKLLKKIVGWALILLIGLSIPADKKMRYILPAAPALALMCGYVFMVARERRYFYFLKRAFVWFCLLFPFISLVAVIALHHRHPEFVFSYSGIITTLVVLMILAFLVQRRELFTFGVAILAFMTMIIMVVEPINLELNRTRDFVSQIENLREQNQVQLGFYREDTDGLPIKYLANTSKEIQPIFLNTPNDLAKLKKSLFVVTSEENYQQMPKKILKKTHVVLKGKIGHQPVVMFKLIHGLSRKNA